MSIAQFGSLVVVASSRLNAFGSQAKLGLAVRSRWQGRVTTPKLHPRLPRAALRFARAAHHRPVLHNQRSLHARSDDRKHTNLPCGANGNADAARRQLGEEISLSSDRADRKRRQRGIDARAINERKRRPNESLELLRNSRSNHRRVERHGDNGVGSRRGDAVDQRRLAGGNDRRDWSLRAPPSCALESTRSRAIPLAMSRAGEDIATVATAHRRPPTNPPDEPRFCRESPSLRSHSPQGTVATTIAAALPRSINRFRLMRAASSRLVATVQAEGGSGSPFVRAFGSARCGVCGTFISETRLADRVTSHWNARNRAARPLIAAHEPSGLAGALTSVTAVRLSKRIQVMTEHRKFRITHALSSRQRVPRARPRRGARRRRHRRLATRSRPTFSARRIPPLLAGSDVLGQAATGTGKTAAFALPLLQRIGASADDERASFAV